MSEPRRYGQWAGNPKGSLENPRRCVEEVVTYTGRFPHYHQCGRNRGHGPDGLYCKQHAPEKADPAGNAQTISSRIPVGKAKHG